ncbi:MAG: hypothetical protein Q7J57_00990 [Gemmobacter sp.]|nr:hypothetical protein [Gemmobacter sp.]
MRPQTAPLNAEGYPGVRALWESATLRRRDDPVFGVTGVVVHVAEHTGSEAAVALMKAGKSSWHWIVPAADEPQHGHFVWAAVPPARAARHVPNGLSNPGFLAGRAQLNHCTLAILVAAATQQVHATTWQVAAAAQIIRHAWAQFPNLSQVICRFALESEPGDPATAMDWQMLRHQVTDLPPDDLPPLVARATPICLLERPRMTEHGLRAQ